MNKSKEQQRARKSTPNNQNIRVIVVDPNRSKGQPRRRYPNNYFLRSTRQVSPKKNGSPNRPDTGKRKKADENNKNDNKNTDNSVVSTKKLKTDDSVVSTKKIKIIRPPGYKRPAPDNNDNGMDTENDNNNTNNNNDISTDATPTTQLNCNSGNDRTTNNTIIIMITLIVIIMIPIVIILIVTRTPPSINYRQQTVPVPVACRSKRNLIRNRVLQKIIIIMVARVPSDKIMPIKAKVPAARIFKKF